ncbi:hypothetical protein EGW08_018717 [Elysia chlorotica]|uniref:Uncharacterized protein n=1 Tax=Elysia chlorotica TaxID=188477 RepID=A0A3S1B2M6_ELYCH|nr:hypothetical protein EGW08_018717 [Elysia chlorotica]
MYSGKGMLIIFITYVLVIILLTPLKLLQIYQIVISPQKYESLLLFCIQDEIIFSKFMLFIFFIENSAMTYMYKAIIDYLHNFMHTIKKVIYTLLCCILTFVVGFHKMPLL